MFAMKSPKKQTFAPGAHSLYVIPVELKNQTWVEMRKHMGMTLNKLINIYRSLGKHRKENDKTV